MTCRYCLQREVAVSWRCQRCADYLDQLHSSDDQADRDFCAVLVVQAAVYHIDRQRGGLRKAA